MSTGIQAVHERASKSLEFRSPVMNDTYNDCILKYQK